MFEENGPAIIEMTSRQFSVAVTRVNVYRPGCGVVRGRKMNGVDPRCSGAQDMWQVVFVNGRPTAAYSVPKLVMKAAKAAWKAAA